MKPLFLIILLFCIESYLSQAYKEMLNHESEWQITSCFSGCLNDIYFTDGDTTYNSNNYKVLNGYHYISRTFWLREDISNKQVFLSTKDGNKRVEDLLYDFSLEIGDSINIKNPLSPLPYSPGFFVLDSISNKQLLDGLFYKHFYLSPGFATSSSEHPIWIEGIGSLNLINCPGGAPDVNGVAKLSCNFNDGQLIYSQLDSIQTCNPVYITSNNKIDNNVIEVYPTVCEDFLSVSSKQHPITSIMIYNVNGTIVKNLKHENKSFSQLNIAELTKGLYFVNVISGGINNVFKVIKQ